MQKEVKQTWFFKQSPEEVWEFLTRPELLEQWLGQTDFQPVAGHKFRFMSPHGNHAYCEVLEVKPFARLSYSWQKKSVNNNTFYNSKVAWTLAPANNGTELQLVHNGFIAMEDVTGHENGWIACLKKFEERINQKQLQ
jgi:uncharacterized protein YndB with AHSA1/START domain